MNTYRLSLETMPPRALSLEQRKLRQKAYSAWYSMKLRCEDIFNLNYGGRLAIGIAKYIKDHNL
jgi:hypothetical protein